MKLPIDRVNLTEKDIEDWLWENPGAIPGAGWEIPYWIGRQVSLPSGIADLVGLAHKSNQNDESMFSPLVAEVKNVPIDSGALGQVMRYASDVVGVFDMLIDEPETADFPLSWLPIKIVIGPSIDNQTFAESVAMGIKVFTFSTELHVNMGSGHLSWTDPYKQDMRERRKQAAESEDFVSALEFLEGWTDADRMRLTSQIPEHYRDIIKR